MSDAYYMAYEARYKAVFGAGAARWGHSPDDAVLRQTLAEWVSENRLEGKKVVEFACGEGACGEILSRLGCVYQGFDVSPTVVERARENLKNCANARVDLLDMVTGAVDGKYDAALDCMGLHMLITDSDRAAYLKNARGALIGGAPMLFFRESYRNDGSAYIGEVKSFDEWKRITNCDYRTPCTRHADNAEVSIPLVAARAKDKDGYISELESAGFAVDRFVEMAESEEIQYSASIFARKIG